MSNQLEVLNVSKTYGENKVLNNIHLTLKVGKITGLLGVTGCGKTTLGKAICGLLSIDSGEIRYNNVPLSVYKKRSFDACADIQYIFQDPYSALEDTFTVKDVLSETLALCHYHKRKDHLTIEEALEMVDLEPTLWLESKIATLSGGQRQKVCFARAILPCPKFIIADEFTAMLDAENAIQMIQCLKKITSKLDIGVLLITHQLDLVEVACEELLIMDHGIIIESGMTNVLVNKPNHELTKKMIESMAYIWRKQVG